MKIILISIMILLCITASVISKNLGQEKNDNKSTTQKKLKNNEKTIETFYNKNTKKNNKSKIEKSESKNQNKNLLTAKETSDYFRMMNTY